MHKNVKKDLVQDQLSMLYVSKSYFPSILTNAIRLISCTNKIQKRHLLIKRAVLVERRKWNR